MTRRGVRRVGALAVAVPIAVGVLSGPARADGERIVQLSDPRLTEASGLVVVGDDLATMNDSGDVGRVFTVDGSTGATVGVTTWSQDPVDVEGLAPAGDDAVWVGDIGDNNASRPFVTIARVPVGPGDRTVDAPTYRLVYPQRQAHNAETLMTDPTTGRVYVATKEVLGGTLYAAPETLDPDGPNRLEAVGPVVTTATDGAFLPDGRGLVIRGYFDATLYAWPSLRAVGSFELPHQRQGEGLAVRPDGSLLLSSEGPRSWVVDASVPAELLAQLPAAPTPTPSASPSPTVSGAPPPVDPDDRTALVLVGGAAVVVALLLGGVLVALRRRRSEDDW